MSVCGGEPFVYYSGNKSDGEFTEVICKQCRCRTDRLMDKAAIEAWNRRADNGLFDRSEKDAK